MKPVEPIDRFRNAPASVRFRDLCRVAEQVGFVMVKQRGSHRRYRHQTYREASLNLQPKGGMAKEYQVRQFLRLVDRYNLVDD